MSPLINQIKLHMKLTNLWNCQIRVWDHFYSSNLLVVTQGFYAALLNVTCIKKGVYHLDIFSSKVHGVSIVSSCQEAVQSINQFVSQWVMVTFRGHLCLLWHCLYLSLRIEVFFKAHSLMCYNIPQLVLWMLWTGSQMIPSCWITLQLMCYVCATCSLLEDCCNMHLGNPSTLRHEEGFIELIADCK